MARLIFDVGIKVTALYSAVCVIKHLLPGGSMGRSANKVVDIVGLISFIRIISGVWPNG